MSENNKTTKDLESIPTSELMRDIFGDMLDQTNSVQQIRRCNNDRLGNSPTVYFNPTINVITSTTDADQKDQRNNPCLSEVGSFVKGLISIAGLISFK